eukprot:918566-Amphidinium_carterae.1
MSGETMQRLAHASAMIHTTTPPQQQTSKQTNKQQQQQTNSNNNYNYNYNLLNVALALVYKLSWACVFPLKDRNYEIRFRDLYHWQLQCCYRWRYCLNITVSVTNTGNLAFDM